MREPSSLAAPPRSVPTALRLCVLAGGPLVLAGWLVLAFGGFMAGVFVGNSELVVPGVGARPGTTTGRVVGAADTSTRLNSTRVRRIEFVFELEGREVRGASFTSRAKPVVGDAVEIEFDPERPAVARISGARMAVFPTPIAFVLFVPATGLLLLLLGLLQNRRHVRTMIDGEAAWAVLTAAEKTWSKVNNQRVHKLTFTAVDARGDHHTIVAHSHLAAWRDEHVARQVLLADDRGSVVDLLPGRPRIDDRGRWRRPGAGRLAVTILPPLLAAATTTIGCAISL
jgi:hypothetical protein